MSKGNHEDERDSEQQVKVQMPASLAGKIWDTLKPFIAAGAAVWGYGLWHQPVSAESNRDAAPGIAEVSSTIENRQNLIEQRVSDMREDVKTLKSDVNEMKQTEVKILTEIQDQRGRPQAMVTARATGSPS